MNRHSYFDISRKIIANMTSESWRTIPHVSVLFEPDVGPLLTLLREYNEMHVESISLNTAVLKIIAEGLRLNPNLNGHIQFNSWLVSGKVTLLDHIDISMPVLYEDDRMITVTLPQAETQSMVQIQRTVSKLCERIRQTNMPRTMYRTALMDTFEGLGHGKVFTAAGRLIGAKIGKGRVRLPKSTVNENSKALRPEEIRQGSVTVSNMGALYRDWRGGIMLLEIIPPQLCAFGIGALQKKPVADDNDHIIIKEILPITIAFDHRALDFSAVAPFMKCVDEFLGDTEKLQHWIEAE